MDTETDRRIRDRAYAIWEREGRPEGRHGEHWHQARLEIAREAQRTAQARRPQAAPAAPWDVARTGSEAAPPTPESSEPAAPEPLRPRGRGGLKGAFGAAARALGRARG